MSGIRFYDIWHLLYKYTKKSAMYFEKYKIYTNFILGEMDF